MNLETIAALAAAGAAATAVPASLLVGRWQMKGALSQAQGSLAQAQAGLTQAESAYRASLDAVKAQGETAHTQWLRGMKRDAFASFLVSAHRVWDIAQELTYLDARSDGREDLTSLLADLSVADRELNNAYSVVSLEVPESGRMIAYNMKLYLDLCVLSNKTQVEIRAAWNKLNTLHSSTTDRILGELHDALTQLHGRVWASGISGDPRIRLQSVDDPLAPATLPSEIADAEEDVLALLRRSDVQQHFTTAERECLTDWAFNKIEQSKEDAENWNNRFQDQQRVFRAYARESLGHPAEPGNE
jgi:hypothetical protein